MNISMHMQCKTYIISVTLIVCKKKIMKKNGACRLVLLCRQASIYWLSSTGGGWSGNCVREINECCLVSFTITQTDLQFLYRRRDDSHPWPFMQRPGQPWCCSAATVHVPSIVTTGYRDLLYTLMIILAHNIKARLFCRLAKNSWNFSSACFD